MDQKQCEKQSKTIWSNSGLFDHSSGKRHDQRVEICQPVEILDYLVYRS